MTKRERRIWREAQLEAELTIRYWKGLGMRRRVSAGDIAQFLECAPRWDVIEAAVTARLAMRWSALL